MEPGDGGDVLESEETGFDSRPAGRFPPDACAGISREKSNRNAFRDEAR